MMATWKDWRLDSNTTLNKRPVNEDHITFSKEEMAQLHKDGKVEKDGHTYGYDESVKKESSLPTKVKQVKKVKGAQPDPTSKKAKEFFQHHTVHSGPHITGQGAEHATYDFDDSDYGVEGGLQKRKDTQKRGYEPVEVVEINGVKYERVK